MRILSYIFFLIVILIGVTFAILNSKVVPINYYIGQSSMPLSILLVISLAIGGVLGLLVGIWMLIKIKIKNRNLKKHVNLLEKEIDNLRAIPLQDKH